MKTLKIVLLLSVLMFVLGGCNKSVFEGMDSYSDSDNDVFYAQAEQTINSGDQTAIAQLESDIEARITSHPEENATLTLLLSEVKMALAGVDLLGTATKLFDLTDESNLSTNITSIFEMTDEEFTKLEEAVNYYNSTLLQQSAPAFSITRETITVDEDMRNTYMLAGIANVMYGAHLLIIVFDTNGDGKVNELDSYESGILTRWSANKTKIIEAVGNTVIFLNIAFQNNLSDSIVTDNEDLVQTINDIKYELSLYVSTQAEIDNETDPVKKAQMKLIDEEEFATILNQVLKGDFNNK